MEPHRLQRWVLPSPAGRAFHTCGRPGRSKKNIKAGVSDAVIHAWVRGLPAEHNVVVLSLLGSKSTGKCEWSFYSFYKERRSFQDWLDQHYGSAFKVIEYPTVDGAPVPNNVLAEVCSRISTLLNEGRTVVVMDSGGVCRVGQVCRHCNASQFPLVDGSRELK